MVKRNAESAIYPSEWDLTSSPSLVYHNTNIIEIPETEDRPLMYSYEVEIYDRMEYLEYINAKLLIENSILTEDMINTQMALCDIYEMLIPAGY